jgi:hypothetical protein
VAAPSAALGGVAVALALWIARQAWLSWPPPIDWLWVPVSMVLVSPAALRSHAAIEQEGTARLRESPGR